MRLAETRKTRLTRTGDALQAEPAEQPSRLLDGLFQSHFVKEVRDLIRLPEQDLGDIEKETIVNSWWLGLLDPDYARQLQSLPWLKDFAYTQARTLYSGEHKQITPPMQTEDEVEKRDTQDLYKTFALGAVRASLQLFPEARHELGLGSVMYSQDSVDQLIQFCRNCELSPGGRILMAVELIQVWPEHRQKIIDVMLQKSEQRLIQRIEQAVAGNNFVDDTTLAIFLLLFPEMRTQLLKNIDQGTCQILQNIQSVSAGTPRGDTNLFFSGAWTVIIMAAQEAHIDDTGRIQVELKQRAPVIPTPLPLRPLA